jgi:hypothetical protein
MKNPRLVASAVLGVQTLVWLPAMAQNTLTVPMEIVRISNPDLSAVNPGSVTLYRFNPQYTLQAVQESSRTELSLGAMIEKSGNTDLSANRTLPNVRVLWESSSPVAVFGLRASLEEASTRETEFAEFGRVTRDSTERIGTLGGTWTRNLTASSSLEFAASHARVSYDTPFLVDYNETRGALTHRVESSASSRYSLLGSVARLNLDRGGESASRGELGVGYEVDISEELALSATGGAVRISGPRRSTHFVGGVRLAYEGERAGYAVAWSRNVGISGSLGGYVRSESFDASLTYPFSINTSLSIGVGHARSLERDRDAGASAYARIRTELTGYWAFTLGLEHRRSMPFVGPTARGNLVAVGLVYSHPDF